MWCFGYGGHAFAGSLSREMEYDADRHAIHLVGSKAFVQSMANIERYGAAHGVAMKNAHSLFYETSVLVQNIPKFTLYIGKTMPADSLRQIAAENEAKKQHLLDTHPPTRERVAVATEANVAGIFKLNRPATDLIHHWENLAIETTADFYSDVLGQRVTALEMTPLEEVLKEEHRLTLQKV